MTPLSPARHVAPNQSADMSAHSREMRSAAVCLNRLFQLVMVLLPRWGKGLRARCLGAFPQRPGGQAGDPGLGGAGVEGGPIRGQRAGGIGLHLALRQRGNPPGGKFRAGDGDFRERAVAHIRHLGAAGQTLGDPASGGFRIRFRPAFEHIVVRALAQLRDGCQGGGQDRASQSHDPRKKPDASR